LTTREQLDDALADDSGWRIRSTLWSEEVEAFVILMAPRPYSESEIQLAWRWFQEGYQCGIAMQTIRELYRSMRDE